MQNLIYALLDIDTLKKYNVSIEEFINRANKVNAQILQYRDKNSSFEQKEATIELIKKLWNKTLIVNDEIELVKYADGLHIGQEDLQKYKSIENVRDKIGRKILGLSTHNEEEIKIANDLDIDYIGLGAYRNTNTKDVTNILGDKLSSLAKLSIHPVAAIGGIRLDDEIENVKYKVIGSDLCK